MTGLRDCHMGSLLFCSALGWFHCIAATHTGHHVKVCALRPASTVAYSFRVLVVTRQNRRFNISMHYLLVLTWVCCTLDKDMDVPC